MDPQAEREQVEALLREWDPIGVIGLPPNEYDSYAPQVHQTLADGCTPESLALTLGRIRTESMGLSACPSADLIAAKKMVEWWVSRDQPEGVLARRGP